MPAFSQVFFLSLAAATSTKKLLLTAEGAFWGDVWGFKNHFTDLPIFPFPQQVIFLEEVLTPFVIQSFSLCT